VSPFTDAELVAIRQFMQDCGEPVTGPLRPTLISGGRSNVTVRLDDGSSRWVLRMPPRAGRTPSAHDVGREYRVTRALMATQVPVPPAVALCDDDSTIGSPFAIARFVDGRTIQTRSQLDALDDDVLDATVARLVEVLATLHAVDPAAVGLEGFGRPDGYAERQLRRWTQQWGHVVADDHPGNQLAAETSEALRRTLPGQNRTCIVHGDYRIDNTLLTVEERAEITAVVDWELSTLGDPVADVAMMCAYRLPAFDFVVGEDSAWTSDRLPGPEGLATAYRAAAGHPLDNWEFHLALAYFKVAVISAGIDHRTRAGAAGGQGFATAGEAVIPYLEAAHQIVTGVG
jgi:aminoglycoside phosphotransferase (APT) family kinase protein